MKFLVTMCHSSLMIMLLHPAEFEKAVISYSATAPEVDMEGMNGYMETNVEFIIRDLEKFTKLYNKSYVFPSDRAKWYWTVRSGKVFEDVNNGRQ